MLFRSGIDIAAGTGGDFSAICVFCRNTREQVAEFYSNRIDPRDVALQAMFASTYYNNALMVPENTDIGLAFIDQLLQSKVANRLYRNAEIPREVVNPHLWTKAYGYINRSQGARVQLLNRLRIEVSGGMAVYSPRLLREGATFIETGTGKWDHQKSCHSDAIFALALAVWGHCERPAVMLQSTPGVDLNPHTSVSFLSMAAAGKLAPLPVSSNPFGKAPKQVGKRQPHGARYR